MMDEDSDGVRIKIIPCAKEQFRRRMEATKMLEDDFYLPKRAQLMLDFLQKHGVRVVKETPGPKKRFRSTLKLIQHVLQKPQHARGSDVSSIFQDRVKGLALCIIPSHEGVCVYTLILS